LLQGLIQIAAALLKTHMGVAAGARTLSSQGLDKLRTVAATHPRLMGVNVVDALSTFAAYFAPLEPGGLPTIGGEVPVLRLTQAADLAT